MIRQRPVRYALGIAVVAMLGLLLLEGILRIVGPRPHYSVFDEKDLWQHDDLLGWRHLPNRSTVVERALFRMEVNTNAAGLRDRERSLRPRDGTKRILVLGDSMVWGFGVEANRRFTERMEEFIPNVEVVNAGIPGYGTDQELLWYRSEGRKCSPDIVLLFLTGDDDFDNRRDCILGVFPKPRFVRTPEGALELKEDAARRSSLVRRLAYQSRRRSSLVTVLLQKLQTRARHSSPGSPPDSRTRSAPLAASPAASAPEAFALTVSLVRALRHEAESDGAGFAVVANSTYWLPSSRGTYPQLVAALRAAEIPVLDLEALPDYEWPRLTMRGHHHWNESGHRFVADKTRAFLAEQSLLEHAAAPRP